MSSSQLIEIADKVFWNRDTEIEKKYKKRYKEEQKRTDQRFAMLAAALGKSYLGPSRKTSSHPRDGKASACNAGDPGLIPRSGRSPGEGNGNPLQCFCLENPRDGGAWWAAIYEIAQSDTTEAT